MFQAFTWKTGEGGGHDYWRNLAERANALADAGFTSIWLPPACKAQGGGMDVGYGIYDLYDIGQYDQKGTVPTRWGTAEEYIGCINALETAGLTTLADVVLNHRMGGDNEETFDAIPVSEDNRIEEHGEPRPVTAWTHFIHPGRADEHSAFHWRWHHFTAVDLEDEGGQRKIYRVADKNFAEQVGLEKGNYDYLMGCDVDLDQEDVRNELFAWGRWFCETTNIGGFRFDAAKHMHASFIKDFIGHTRHEAGRPLPSVCEYAIGDAGAIHSFIDQTEGSVHAFDFPLREKFQQASADAEGFDLRTLFDDTLLSVAPDHAVPFVDNHDTAPSKGEEAPEPVQVWFKPIAYATILLRKAGWPCVFIGDYDASGDGDHSIADGNRSGLGNFIDKLIHARRHYCFGEQFDYFDDPRVIAWRWGGDDQHPGQLIVICSSGAGGELGLDTGRPGEKFRDLLGGEHEVTTADDGRAGFPYPAGGVAVWGSVE